MSDSNNINTSNTAEDLNNTMNSPPDLSKLLNPDNLSNLMKSASDFLGSSGLVNPKDLEKLNNENLKESMGSVLNNLKQNKDLMNGLNSLVNTKPGEQPTPDLSALMKGVGSLLGNGDNNPLAGLMKGMGNLGSGSGNGGANPLMSMMKGLMGGNNDDRSDLDKLSPEELMEKINSVTTNGVGKNSKTSSSKTSKSSNSKTSSSKSSSYKTSKSSSSKKKPKQKSKPFEYSLETTLEELYHGKVKKLNIKRTQVSDETGDEFVEKHKIRVNIEPGMEDSELITLENEGHHESDKIPGDVLITLVQAEHDVYERVDNHLLMEVDVSIADTLCGAIFELTHLNGKKYRIRSPVGDYLHANESIRKIPGLGMPYQNSETGKLNYGCLYIRFNVILPSEFDNSESVREKLMELFPSMLNHSDDTTVDREFTLELLSEDEYTDLCDSESTGSSSSGSYESSEDSESSDPDLENFGEMDNMTMEQLMQMMGSGMMPGMSGKDEDDINVDELSPIEEYNSEHNSESSGSEVSGSENNSEHSASVAEVCSDSETE